MALQNRIVGESVVRAKDLVPHPSNWRLHGSSQLLGLSGVLGEVGWVQRVVVNKRTGYILDGHARVSLASSRDDLVPVLYVDLDPREERLVLATLDPLGAMADRSDSEFELLMNQIRAESPEMLAVLDEIFKSSDVELLEEEAESADEDPKLTTCPSCGHEF